MIEAFVLLVAALFAERGGRTGPYGGGAVDGATLDHAAARTAQVDRALTGFYGRYGAGL